MIHLSDCCVFFGWEVAYGGVLKMLLPNKHGTMETSFTTASPGTAS